MGKRNNVQLAVKSTVKIRDKIKFPVIVQPKLNGVRALVSYERVGEGLFDSEKRVVIRSSENNIYRIPHIEDFLLSFFEKHPNEILDGEIYIHGEPLNKIIARIPKTNAKGTVSKASLPTEDLEFHIFDLKNDAIQHVRLTVLQNYNHMYFSDDFEDASIIQVLPFYHVQCLQHIERFMNQFVEDGFEGLIYRFPMSTYTSGTKRVALMGKYKRWINTECKVLDIVSEGMKNNVYVLKALLKNDINDATFLCNFGGGDITFTNAYKEQIFNNKAKYIGKMCTIRFYERTGTKDKKPFHANIESFRNGLE